MIGKVLGLDLGEKTLGVAVSDIMGIIATGVETFRFPDSQYEDALSRVKYFVETDLARYDVNFVFSRRSFNLI